MAELQADLSLDTSEAESNIDALGPLFEEVTTGFADQLADALTQLTELAPPDIDTSSIEASLEAAGESGAEAIAGALEGIEAPPVEVEADVGPAIDAIEGIEAEPVEIEIVAVTDDAQGNIEALGDAASETSDSMSKATDSTSGFSAAGSIASGSASGLTHLLTTLGATTGLVGGALAATAVVAGLFVNEAIDAQGATERFDAALGPLAERVENLQDVKHMTGLNQSLGELALQLGSDDDKIRTTVARLFELSVSTGRSREEASLFVQEMVALGANAVALNPALGDVGDVTTQLVAAFTRGGKRASDLGISLSSAEIVTRALKDTGKATAEELSVVDKTMAGAAIAAGRYGTSIAKNVAEGSNNALIVQRRFHQSILETFEALGTPLVTPVFTLMENALPVIVEVGTVFGQLAEAALPALLLALEVVGPAVKLLGDAFALLGPVLPIIVQTFIAMKVATLGLAVAQGVLAAVTAAGTINMVGFAATAEVAGASAATAGLTMQAAVPAIAAFTASFLITTAVLNKFAGGSKDASEELDTLESAVAAVSGTTDDQLVKSFDNAVGAARKFNKAQQESSDGLQLTNKALRANVEQYTVFRDVAEQSIGTAARLLEQYKDQPEVYARLKQILDEVVTSQRSANDAQAASIAIVNAQQVAIDSLSSSIAIGVPQSGQVFRDWSATVQQAFGEEATPSVASFVDNLQSSVDEVRTHLDNIKFIMGAGLTGIASLLASQDPKVGNHIVEELRNSDPELVKAWDAALLTNTGKLNQMETEAAALSTAVATAIVRGLEPTPENVAAIMAETNTAVAGAAGPIGASGEAAGAAGTAGFGAGVSGMPAEAQSALGGVAGVMNQAFSIVGSPANIAGLIVGQQFGAGMVAGIDSYIGRIADKSAEAVRAAERSARSEAQSQSPSKLFADLGADLSLGLAEGIEDQTKAVQRSMREVVLATAASATGGSSGSGSATQFNFAVEVHGVTDPAVARQVGQQVGNGAVDALTRRGVVVAARTN